MSASDIVIKGAREHNLQDVALTIPRNQLVVFTGVSGSGKSSLAFDTVYAEGQRRYVESLSSFARQFLGQMPKPEVDYIGGLSPSISISQKTAGNNPRSTVGTITEIYDYLRLIYARCGQGFCHQCNRPITAQTREQIIDRILALPQGTHYSILAPMVRRQKGEHRELFVDLLKQGFIRARVDGNIVSLTGDISLDRKSRHNIEVVVDRLENSPDVRARLGEAVELALRLGSGDLIITHESVQETPESPDADAEVPKDQEIFLSAHYACTHCGLSFEPPSPQLFSFNSPHGMCLECDGLGERYGIAPDLLISDPSKSFRQGCIELVGEWDKIGRWRQHIYQGMVDTIESHRALPAGSMLDTVWEKLSPELQQIWLWGTGEEHVTFTWKQAGRVQKYGGSFEGIIPSILSKYRNTKSKMQRRQLEDYMRVALCPRCSGQRLNPQACHVRMATLHEQFKGKPALSLPEVVELSIVDASKFFSDVKLDRTAAIIAQEALKEIRGRLGFLQDVGLDYLALGRTAPTLSGGEAQRIRLAGQIGSGLVGVLYILDEPSIGLHPRDNDRLIQTLQRLRDMGNTVVVVEHDEDTMRAADHLIDFGPGPGVRGGHVVASGSVEDLGANKKSLTGQFLSGRDSIPVPERRRPPGDKRLRILGAEHHNLRCVDVEIPLELLVCVTGVSGSGKSSLVNDILAEVLRRDLNRGDGDPGKHREMTGIDQLDKLIAIDQSPIGRTPRSNPATYIKVFDDIRRLFTQLPEARSRGYKPGRFSFNVAGGRCEACEGNGSNRLEMDFLADVWVTCPVCEGHRFNHETLQLHYKGKSIADVLEMDVQEALTHFENIPPVSDKLQTLHNVGLDYLKLGQPSPTLSGGEAQRIKLARELAKKSTGRTLYLLDEPTTGLHFADTKKLLEVLNSFVEVGNTVLVVEHNLDVIKTSDWVIDIGPEGGDGGGHIVCAGTPEHIAATPESYTGRALAPLLNIPNEALSNNGQAANAVTARKVNREVTELRVSGARQHNLKDIDLTIPRDKMTVFCGPSGSGKTSLAMDTIYAEGQRRYVESLSSYARQFVGQMPKPRLDHIEGLSPAIAIEQKHMGHTPRSTVGTVTEVYDYLRVLMAQLGTPYCPDCDLPIGTQSADEIIEKILTEPEGTKLYIMAPVELQTGQTHDSLWETIRSSGYARVRIDGTTHAMDDIPKLDRRRKHLFEIILDRISIRPGIRSRVADSVENALALGKGMLHVAYVDEKKPEPKWQIRPHNQHYACDHCGRSFQPLASHNFSFNSSLGWCEACQGLGTQTGANPAALLRDAKLTIAQGAVALWPDVSQQMFDSMLQALCEHTGLAVDVPFDQLSLRHRRVVLHGTGNEWIAVPRPKPGRKKKATWFHFQYKGLYPALEETARVSPSFRTRLDHLVDEVECIECGGSRLREDAAAVRFREQTIGQICRQPLGELLTFFKQLKLNPRERKIAGELIKEVSNRLSFLNDVGLEYLTLSRRAPSLSGGEAQRIRLASQVGSGLCGVLYVLDEPTIGLHPRDNKRLLGALKKLRDLGNTLLVVEHDREVVESADYLLDFGPAAGEFGGTIVARGKPSEIGDQANSVTGPYISGTKAIPIPSNRRTVDSDIAGSDFAGSDMRDSDVGDSGRAEKNEVVGKGARRKSKPSKGSKRIQLTDRREVSEITPPSGGWIEVVGARHNNLRNIDVRIPLGTLTTVTGVSGSGKSSLVEDVLYSALARLLHRARALPGAFEGLRGVEQINKVIRVNQRPLGNSPTSNPATYTGVFDLIRTLYSQLPDAKVRGYTPRRFSFNTVGGRCDACEGNGQIRIEMHFLPDVWITCDTCNGLRYNPETLAVRFHGQSVADVLNMSCERAAKLFENIPKIRRTLQTLCDVGLGYVRLGQPAPTLSGGEAQRVKLASELARPDTGRTLYLLDEPTTGLHFNDLAKLLDVLHRLVDLGNTVVVIEHNLDIIKSADWLIDMGPEAGEEGGQLVVAGTPEDLVRYSQQERKLSRKKTKGSDSDPPWLRCYTGELLEDVLAAGPYVQRNFHDPALAEEVRPDDIDIAEVGRDSKMPWETDGHRWHTEDRIGSSGEPCRWDGRIIAKVVNYIEEQENFSPTDWNSRTTVEICGEKKSDGWFFHALTGDQWLVTLKFRVAKRTFNRADLVEKLGLTPLNEMENLPIYGADSRVKCKNLRGPWQEIQLLVHDWAEIDRPEFWEFLDQSIQAFQKLVNKKQESPEAVMPWMVLGQKWHLSRKGFPPGKKVAWPLELLEDLCELITESAPGGQFLWNNQQVIHYCLPGESQVWATVYTKRLAAVELQLAGPKGQFTLGQISSMRIEGEIITDRESVDVIKVRFNDPENLTQGELAELLTEHAQSSKQISTSKR